MTRTSDGGLAGIRIRPGDAPALGHRATDGTLGLAGKEQARDAVAALSRRLRELQSLLAADGTRALLVVLQGMDASGKDGVARALVRDLNPMILQVRGFSAPTEEERRHDFLWRIVGAMPARGEIGVFNRSHYEDVLVVRVEGLAPETVWRPRFAAIAEWEARMHHEGVAIVKFLLHISPEVQLERLRERVAEPLKRWKYRAEDLARRPLWGTYMAAYEEAIARTSTDDCPWYVVPADRKWVRDWAVLQTVVDTLEAMHLPEPAMPAGVPPALLPDRSD
ncbi:MAG TPA: PPK2 family polyphosphate kinase [Miltoncostaeaceae bacterium]|nr:PPK2 family polyphosphate kinase [Miltoncostaeaceae bacterium]